MEVEVLNSILTLGAGAAVGIIGMWFMYNINMKGIGALVTAINGLVVELKELSTR